MRSACRASPPIDWAFNGMRGCPPQMQSPATNSQGFTGLPLAVAFFSSRHRDACRSVGTGFRLVLYVVFIDRGALHSRLHITLGHPRRDPGDATRVTPFAACSGFPARDNPQTSHRGWSLPVRLRYTRNTGRAQQRDTSAATGSSVVGLRIHPEPNHQSTFS